MGFLDKTLCDFNVTGESGGDDAAEDGEDEPGASDWVRFNAALKIAKFSFWRTWFAALGGSSVLVVRDGADYRFEKRRGVWRGHGG